MLSSLIKTNQNLNVCVCCRKYGVKLLENRCEICYALDQKPQSFQPGKLPYGAVDLVSGEMVRTSKTYSKKDYEV